MTGSGSTIDWNAQPLGRLSDHEIAKHVGVTRQAVGQQRRARGIPPARAPAGTAAHVLTLAEREQLAALELGLAQILASDSPELTVATATAVDLTPEWQCAAQRVQRTSGRLGRATAFRFRAPGRRTWTAWMNPRAARAALLQQGWADAAQLRIDQLTLHRAPTETA